MEGMVCELYYSVLLSDKWAIPPIHQIISGLELALGLKGSYSFKIKFIEN